MAHVLVNDLGDGFITFPEFEKQLRAYEYALDHPTPPVQAPRYGYELQNLQHASNAAAQAQYQAMQNAAMQPASVGTLIAARLPQRFTLGKNIARLICSSHDRYLEKDEYGEMFCRGCRDEGQTTPLKGLKLGGSL